MALCNDVWLYRKWYLSYTQMLWKGSDNSSLFFLSPADGWATDFSQGCCVPSCGAAAQLSLCSACLSVPWPVPCVYTELKLYCAYYGKGLDAPFVGCLAQYLLQNRASLEYKHSNKQKIKNLDLLELLGDKIMVGYGLHCFPKTRCLMSLIQLTTNHLPCYTTDFGLSSFSHTQRLYHIIIGVLLLEYKGLYLNKVSFHIPNTWNYYYTNNTQVGSPTCATHEWFQQYLPLTFPTDSPIHSGTWDWESWLPPVCF